MRTPKKQPGRNRTYPGELKEKRHYSLTKTAHEGFLRVAHVLGMKSRSQLAEAIGRQEVFVTIPTQSDILMQEIPIYPRLKAVLEEPVSRFRSTLNMARILAYQLGITDSKEEFYQSEQVVIDAVLSAFVILALEDYLHPEQYLIDVSSAMQWLVFKIMIGKSGFEEEIPSPSFSEFIDFYQSDRHADDDIHPPVKQIYDAFSQLKLNFPLHYQVMYMRMIQGLSFPKVRAILKVRGTDLTETEAFFLVREGIKFLRQAWHDFQDAGASYIIKPVDESLSYFMQPLMQQANYFYDILQQDKTDKDEGNSRYLLKTWELFLLKTMIQPSLGLWIGEVLHVRGHEFDVSSNTSREQCRQYQEAATAAIAESLEEEVLKHLDTLKSRLRFSGFERRDLNETLRQTVNEIARVELPEVYFSEKRKPLEGHCWYENNDNALVDKCLPNFIFPQEINMSSFNLPK